LLQKSFRKFSSQDLIVKQDVFMLNKRSDIFQESWVTKLTNRCILSVRGRDATELLQNTSTQDMKLFEKSIDRAAIYTSFLTVKGKTMLDAFVVKPRLAGQTSDDMEYWVDIHENDEEQLRKHLRKYAMRKNIQIENISHVIKSFSMQSLAGVGSPEGFFFP